MTALKALSKHLQDYQIYRDIKTCISTLRYNVLCELQTKVSAIDKLRVLFYFYFDCDANST